MIRLWLAIMVVFGAVWVAPAGAHHIRGIPHYSYQDHYPETPVYELTEDVDGYMITFTYYQIPGQMALDLAMYVRDSVSQEPYDGAVVFKVWGRHEDPETSHPFTAYRNPTNIYKVGWVYEEAGEYYVRIQFTDLRGEHRAVFELAVGVGNKAWTYLGGSVALMVVAAVITGVVRRKRRKTTGRRP
jgi:hypothetical protein